MPRVHRSHPLATARAIAYGRAPLSALKWDVDSDAPVLSDLICEWLDAPQKSTQAIEALRAVKDSPNPNRFYDAVVHQLHSPWASVRVQALRLLQTWPSEAREQVRSMIAEHTGDGPLWGWSLAPRTVAESSANCEAPRSIALDELQLLHQIIATDDSWTARQEALRTVATLTTEHNRLYVLFITSEAVSDPHWRVRNALVQMWRKLKSNGLVNQEELSSSAKRQRVNNRIRPFAAHRAAGICELLEYLCSDNFCSDTLPSPIDVDAAHAVQPPKDHWDWDPSVLALRLDEAPLGEPLQWPKFVSHYLSHPDVRVVRAALRHASDVDAMLLAEAMMLMDDPRHPAIPLLQQWQSRLDNSIRKEASRFILRQSDPSGGQLAWALQQTAWLEEPFQEISRWLHVSANVSPGEETNERRAYSSPRAELARQLPNLIATNDSPSTETIIDTLRSLSLDESLEVRLAALDGLNQCSTWLSPDDIEEVWIRHGRSSLAADRLAATRIVAKASGWSGHQQALRQLQSDGSYQVRRQLAQVAQQARTAVEDTAWNSTWGEILHGLQSDSNPLVRAAAIDDPRARQLIDKPEVETSWTVLMAAAHRAKISLGSIEPELPTPVQPTPATRPVLDIVVDPAKEAKEDTERVGINLGNIRVSRIAISGHYGLPVEGFVRSVLEGVNLFFWEPGYTTMTAFSQSITPSTRRQLHFIGGTFKATPKGIRKDVERMMTSLQLERISLFLLFWTRSWQRITDEVLAELDRLEQSGDVARASISTHDRELACQAMRGEAPSAATRMWNPIMVRYSAAHRRAEESVLPTALETETSVITFNNTCYGRLLEPTPTPTGSQEEGSGFDAADCYRFALGHPAVAVSLSAPANMRQLEENLAALHDPALPELRRQAMLRHGERVYQSDQVFRRLVRDR